MTNQRPETSPRGVTVTVCEGFGNQENEQLVVLSVIMAYRPPLHISRR